MMNISLPEELLSDLDQAIMKGHFGTRSEFVRTALREYLGLKKTPKTEIRSRDLPSGRYVA